MAATTTRTFRCADDPWDPAMDRARAEGRTLTDVLVGFLQRYAAGDPAALAVVPPERVGSSPG